MGTGSKLMRLLFVVFMAVFFAGTTLASDSASSGADSLKLIVYGATGRVGSRVVEEALNRGHRVTAVSRDPGRVEKKHENLSAVKGNVLDPESVAALVEGQDIVVVSVRGSVDKSKKPEKTVHRLAAEVIVNVLRDMGAGAPRLIFVGGAGSLEIKPGVLYADKLSIFIPGFVRQEIAGHVLTLDYLRGVDDVRWTYISPAKKFKPGKRTGNYRIGGDQMLKDARGKSKISMEDFSIALIDEAENSKFIGERFSVAY